MLVYGYKGTATSVTIPGEIEGMPVHVYSDDASWPERSFYGGEKITGMTLSKGVSGFSVNRGLPKLKKITVEAGNPNFASVDGVLLNKGKTELILYPGGKTDKAYTVPASVTTIRSCAFYEGKALTSITIPDTVTTIGLDVFIGCKNLTISCYSGSAAHTYAKQNNIPFTLLKVESYTVKFNKNGGSGTMKNQTITIGKSTKLTANSFARKGYAFSGWNTKKDGSGTKYTNKKSVKNLVAKNKSITDADSVRSAGLPAYVRSCRRY